MIQGDQISNFPTPGTEAKAGSGWKWVWTLVGLEVSGVSGYNPPRPPGSGQPLAGRLTPPLFLQRLFKGLIDRLGFRRVRGLLGQLR